MWISRKAFNEFKANMDALLAQLEKMKDQTVLISIERTGRVNKFTFARGTQVHQIETMGLISDDLPGWKKDLIR